MFSFRTSLQFVFLSTGSLFGEEPDSAKINMFWFFPIPMNQLESDITADKQIILFNLNYLNTFRKLQVLYNPRPAWLVTVNYPFLGLTDFYLVLSEMTKIINPSFGWEKWTNCIMVNLKAGKIINRPIKWT